MRKNSVLTLPVQSVQHSELSAASSLSSAPALVTCIDGYQIAGASRGEYMFVRHIYVHKLTNSRRRLV